MYARFRSSIIADNSGDGPGASRAAEVYPHEQRLLLRADRLASQVVAPVGSDGIGKQIGLVGHRTLEDTGHADNAAVAVAHDRKRLGKSFPPVLQGMAGGRAFVRRDDRADVIGVLELGWLNRVRGDTLREERLPHDGILDQVQHVRGESPQLGTRGSPRFRCAGSARRRADSRGTWRGRTT